MKNRLFNFLTFVVVLSSSCLVFGAERIPRISYVGGDVAIQTQGDSGWESADTNMPLQEGDILSVEKNGLAEVQVDDGSFVRVNRSSEVRFDQLRRDRILLNMRFGDVIVHVRSSADYFVQTPQGTVRLQQEGIYRVTAENANIVEIQVKSGRAHFENSEVSRKVSSGRRLVVTDGDEEVMGYLSREDDFDEWSDERDSRFASVYQSSRYIPASVSYGVYDLDTYGTWVNVPSYGYCWRPTGIWGDWAPYRYGYWRHCGPWGYTWVSYDPWGWLPYHYGRWSYTSSWGWVWLPGSSWGIDVWCPGVVRFSMWGGNVGWCPLGPGDYYWDYWRYGSGYHHGNNYYNCVNVNHNAVTYLNTDDFRRGRPIGAGTYNRNLLIGNSARGSQAVNFRTDSGTARQLFQRERVLAGAPRIDPLRTASAGRVAAGRSRDVTARDGSTAPSYGRGSSSRYEGRGTQPSNQASRGSARSDDTYTRGAGGSPRSDTGSRGSQGSSYDHGNRGRPGVDSSSSRDASRSRSYDGSSSSRSGSSGGSSRSDYSRGSSDSSRGSTGSSRSDYSRGSSDSSSRGTSGSSGSDSSRGNPGSSTTSPSRPGRSDSDSSYNRGRSGSEGGYPSYRASGYDGSSRSTSSGSSRGSSTSPGSSSRSSTPSSPSYSRSSDSSPSSGGSSRSYSPPSSSSSSRSYSPPSSSSSNRSYSPPPSSSSSRSYSPPPSSSGRSYSSPSSSSSSGRSYSPPPSSSGSSSRSGSSSSSSGSSDSGRRR